MAIYLQVRAGPVHVLLDALAVHEVLSLDKLNSGAGDHCEWRNTVLKALNLAAFLGFDASKPDMGVVFGSDQVALPVMLQVDEVIRLRDLRPADWSPLPHVPMATRQYFDAIYLDADGVTQVYRLIKGLHFGTQAVSQAAAPEAAHPMNP